MPLTRVIRLIQTDRLRHERVVPSTARSQRRQGRLALPAAIAPYALIAVLAACADSPTMPGATASEPLFNAALSRSYPVGGAPSALPPASALPTVAMHGPEVLQGRSLAAPLMNGAPGVTPRAFADPSAALQQPSMALPGGTAAPAAVVAGKHLVWQNTTSGERSIWIMSGTTWQGQYVLLPTTATAWQMVAAADFNADGQPDIVLQNTSTGDRAIWLMNGAAYSGTSVALPNVAVRWRIVAAGDFNGDGKPDLVWQDITNGDRSIWFMNGTTWPGGYAMLPNEPTAWSIAAADDFTGDNKPDLVWQNSTTGQRSIWFMNGATWTGAYSLLQTVPVQWRIAAAGDFNADGFSDLVWQNTATGERSIWLMSGPNWNGSYALLPTVATAWSIATAGNFTTPVGGGPGTPTNLTPSAFVSSSPAEITINWTPGSGTTTQTVIERATFASVANASTASPTQWTQVAVVGGGVSTYTDASGLAPGSRYFYRVSACNTSGCSFYSANAAAETAPASITPITLGNSVIAAPTAQGSSRWYQLTLPAGRSTLTVNTSGGTGESDLNVRYNTLSGVTGGCSTAQTGTTETCTVNLPAGGTYYIQLFGRGSFTNVNVVAN